MSDKYTISEYCPCGCNEIRVYKPPHTPDGIVFVQCLRCGMTGDVGVDYLERIIVRVKELYDNDRRTGLPAIKHEDVAMLRWDLNKFKGV